MALYHATREQGTLVAPRLWAEVDVGRAKLNKDEKRQPCASDSGVLFEPGAGTGQGVRQDKKKNYRENRLKPRRRPSGHYEQPKDKD